MMKASQQIRERIMHEEGFSAKPYRDDMGGTPRIEHSIGYGHQIKPGEEWMMTATLTKAQAGQIFNQDLERFETAINKQIKVPIQQNQFDALLMFTYNLGEGKLSKLSPLINAGRDSTEVASRMLQYVYWKGNPKGGDKPFEPLVRRRKYEADLFLSHLKTAVVNTAKAAGKTLQTASTTVQASTPKK